MISDPISISYGSTSAQFAITGAELVRLRHNGTDFLWNGDPKWWDFCAPILFPVIGRSPNDTIRVDGKPHPMPPHGFARDREFRLIAQSPCSATFELSADSRTLAMFPFEFRLRISASIGDARIAITASIENPGFAPIPFCFGYHPAFVWPQAQATREDFVCQFENNETFDVRRPNPASGLIGTSAIPTPIQERELRLRDSLFEDGALLFDTLSSRKIWFGSKNSQGILVSFPNSPHLGIWTKPGAPFLCIEPWQGLAEREGGDGEISRRPGATILAPGQVKEYRLVVDLDVPSLREIAHA